MFYMFYIIHIKTYIFIGMIYRGHGSAMASADPGSCRRSPASSCATTTRSAFVAWAWQRGVRVGGSDCCWGEIWWDILGHIGPYWAKSSMALAMGWQWDALGWGVWGVGVFGLLQWRIFHMPCFDHQRSTRFSNVGCMSQSLETLARPEWQNSRTGQVSQKIHCLSRYSILVRPKQWQLTGNLMIHCL